MKRADLHLADLYVAFVAFGLVGVVGAAYVVRSMRKGRARHARTDADGGSVLLGKPVMELGYWLLEPLVNLLVVGRVTPAAVTLFSLVPAAGAAVALAFGWFALAALLGTVAATSDLVDGLLARRLGVASDAGEALDAAVDRATEFLFLAGLAIYYRAHVGCLALVLAALLGSFMVSYTTAKAEAMKVSVPRGHMRRPERAVYLLVAAALTAITRVLGATTGEGVSFVLGELPIIGALLLVATVTGVSTVTRLRAVIAALRARDHVRPPEAAAPVKARPAPVKAPAGLT